jgi:hypothetical protein
MALLLALSLAVKPVTPRPLEVLFVGNSFTFGATSAVLRYRAETVDDRNRDGIGGVPALFKLFADQLNVPVTVALETSPGKTLQWHFQHKQREIDGRWDHVVLQEYSTLDPDKPGDATRSIEFAGRLTRWIRARTPDARVSITSNWTRPDLTVPAGQHWSGKPITRMAIDLRKGIDRVVRANPQIVRVHPVGEAFNCAIAADVADANPYDGIDAGKVNLWGYDHYHAGTPGYYLSALVIFAGVTGLDPRQLGERETAAYDLGLDPAVATKLQTVAWQMVRGGGCKPTGVR